MKKNTKLLIYGLVALIICGVIAVFILHIKTSEPKQIIEYQFSLKLPELCEIVHFESEGEGLTAKIKLPIEDIQSISNQLDIVMGSQSNQPVEFIPPFGTINWWDLKREDVNMFYAADLHKPPNVLAFHTAWAIITKESEGYIFLYLSTAYMKK